MAWIHSVWPAMTSSSPSPQELLKRSQLLPLFEEHGFRISKSLFEKLCAAGKGPKPDYYWGCFARYTPGTSLAWIRSRLRPGNRPPRRKRA
jgi:hypothetical protein